MDVSAVSNVLNHIHARLQNVLRSVAYFHVRIQSVRQKQYEEILDEFEIQLLLHITVQGYIFGYRKNEHVQRRQIGTVATVRIRSVLQ